MPVCACLAGGAFVERLKCGVAPAECVYMRTLTAHTHSYSYGLNLDPCAPRRGLPVRCMCVCSKVKNSQARTGHQRGMGGRWTDDDGTHERHTDTNRLTRHTASWLPHTLSWRTHDSRPHLPCRPPQHSTVTHALFTAQFTVRDRLQPREELAAPGDERRCGCARASSIGQGSQGRSQGSRVA